MKFLKIIPVFLFLIFISGGCARPGFWVHGQTEDEVSVKNNISSEVTTSVDDIRVVISPVIDAMVEAYKNKNIREFMSYVSSDFTGDEDILEMAVQRDFSFFNNIELRYVLNTLSADSNGKIFVTLTYNRFLMSSRSGESYTDNGTTAFVFHPGLEHPLMYSMKRPLLFGLSNTDEVASGTVIASGNTSSIVVDERGNLSVRSNSSSSD